MGTSIRGIVFIQPARLTALLGSVIGLLSTPLPWWRLEWRWEGGLVERSISLYSNTVTGDLSGLGVAGNIGMNIPSYEFANFSLFLVILGFAAGMYGVAGNATRAQASRALSSLLFLLASAVFLIGLSTVLSEKGDTIFSSRTLASPGSHVTTGLALGFYFVLIAVIALGFSYMLGRRSMDRRRV